MPHHTHFFNRPYDPLRYLLNVQCRTSIASTFTKCHCIAGWWSACSQCSKNNQLIVPVLSPKTFCFLHYIKHCNLVRLTCRCFRACCCWPNYSVWCSGENKMFGGDKNRHESVVFQALWASWSSSSNAAPFGKGGSYRGPELYLSTRCFLFCPGLYTESQHCKLA